jgi:hypothetical protein
VVVTKLAEHKKKRKQFESQSDPRLLIRYLCLSSSGGVDSIVPQVSGQRIVTVTLEVVSKATAVV